MKTNTMRFNFAETAVGLVYQDWVARFVRVCQSAFKWLPQLTLTGMEQVIDIIWER